MLVWRQEAAAIWAIWLCQVGLLTCLAGQKRMRMPMRISGATAVWTRQSGGEKRGKGGGKRGKEGGAQQRGREEC